MQHTQYLGGAYEAPEEVVSTSCFYRARGLRRARNLFIHKFLLLDTSTISPLHSVHFPELDRRLPTTLGDTDVPMTGI